VIAQTGPGGDFLSTKHTARHVRKAQWRPTIINRKGYERWSQDGGADLREQARRKALRLLAAPAAAPLAADLAARIDELVEAFSPAG
jgi:trimethylamine--corrinoid protein Co-methyltransferase